MKWLQEDGNKLNANYDFFLFKKKKEKRECNVTGRGYQGTCLDFTVADSVDRFSLATFVCSSAARAIC